MEVELCCENASAEKKYLCELRSFPVFKVFNATASTKQAMVATIFLHLGFSHQQHCLVCSHMEQTGRYPAQVTGAQGLQQTREHTKLAVLVHL